MKRQVRTYTFTPGGAGAGTVALTNFTTIRLDAILMVVNTTRGVVLFNLADPAKSGTVATNVLTLATSTSGHSSGDSLYIVYDDDDLDFDTGAGVDRRHAVGLLVPASGGAVAVPGDGTNGLKTNVMAIGGTAIDTNSGNKSGGTQRVVLATDQPALTNGLSTTEDPQATSGGLSNKHFVSAASNNATSLKASAGRLYEVVAMNLSSSPRYLKFYDKASSPTPGSDTIVMVVPIPGNTTGAGIVWASRHGRYFGTGIAYAVVAGIADADNTSVSASDCVVSIGYK